jgi:uncharacterized protein (DUF4415 family)
MQKKTPSFASSQPEKQNAESKTYIVRRAYDPSEPLSEESRKELEALSHLPDSEIDYSDIPATTEADWKDAVRGPILPLEPHTITLALDAEVYEWLEREGNSQAYQINFVLKREAQRRMQKVASHARDSARMSKAS